MQTLKIDKKNAVTAYLKADEKGKELLSNLFGKEILSGNIMDMVKTFEDAEGLDSGWTDKDEFYLQSVKQATIITRVLNEGWVPDYGNKSQPKYYVWMEYDRALSAFRFGHTYGAYTVAGSAAGSRHVFKTAELAKYFVTQFNTLVNQILL